MITKPCILLIAPLCYPPAGSEAIVTSKLVLAMVQAGWEIDVISQGDFGQFYPTQDDSIWEPVRDRLICVDGVKRGGLFDRLASSRRLSFLQKSRSLLWALKATLTAFKLLRSRRYDAIFSRVAPQYGHLPALLLSFCTSTPWCAAWSDPMPPQKALPPYGQGLTARISPLQNVYLKAVSTRAEWHVFPCERLRNFVASYLHDLANKSSSIPHIALPEISSSQLSTFDDSCFTICFAGSLANRDSAAFLKGVKLFLEAQPTAKDIIVIFISNSLDRTRELITDLSIEATVTLHSEKQYQETLDIMARSSVQLVIEACCSEGIFFPSKFVDFVQIGRPILAVSPRNGTLADILSQHGGGIAVDCTSAEDVAFGIATLYQSWESGQLDEHYSSKRLLPLFCENEVLSNYLKIINTNKKMVEDFCADIEEVLGLSTPVGTPPPLPNQSPPTIHPSPQHVAIIWQRFLPYHRARIRQTQLRLASLGHRLTAIEVASQDASYGFAETEDSGKYGHVCCFPGSSYHDHTASEIHRAVRQVLTKLHPDVVFAPATPFPEGMAADAHRLASGCRRVMMDDAWEQTDRRGWLTSAMKRLIHRNIDGVFIPAPSHLAYYERLGFPRDRAVFGVDVVDNGYFHRFADAACAGATAIRTERGLPEKYFLFVGRFLPRKGLETLVTAYDRYRAQTVSEAWELVLVGGGPHLANIQALAENVAGVQFAGVVTGEDLCQYYGLAQTLIVPSVLDPWGLVVNEGLAAGLPVLVSRGCGAAGTLVAEGENGWTFAPEDTDELTGLMLRVSVLTDELLTRMGSKSREIIANWSLDRFADGVVEALNLPRRAPAGMLADMTTKAWKGRVSVN